MVHSRSVTVKKGILCFTYTLYFFDHRYSFLIAEKDQRKKTNDDEDFLVDGKHWSVNSKRKRTHRYSEPEPESDGMLIITKLTQCVCKILLIRKSC